MSAQHQTFEITLGKSEAYFLRLLAEQDGKTPSQIIGRLLRERRNRNWRLPRAVEGPTK